MAPLASGCGTPATVLPTDLPTPALTASPAPTPAVTFVAISADGIPATVTRVVDGDTIHATVAGKDEKIRIIGLDSPETNKPRTPIECFALESTAAARALLPVGTPIRLQPDPSQAARDRFDRLLAHVVLPDGRLFAEIMISNGDAIHYVYDGVPSIYADRLAAAEVHAREAQAGIWSTSTCGGNDHAPSRAP